MMDAILETLRHGLLSRSALDTLPEGVWKRTGALNTWGTNAIEGNTLTRDEVEQVLLEQRSVGNRPLPDILETTQHAVAFAHLLERRKAPIRLETVLELHDEVFGGIKTDTGQWRRVNVRIAGMKHVPPRMEKVVPAMTDWLEAYTKRDTEGEKPLHLGAWMHFEFEAIHPFSDGNGRVGRLRRDGEWVGSAHGNGFSPMKSRWTQSALVQRDRLDLRQSAAHRGAAARKWSAASAACVRSRVRRARTEQPSRPSFGQLDRLERESGEDTDRSPEREQRGLERAHAEDVA